MEENDRLARLDGLKSNGPFLCNQPYHLEETIKSAKLGNKEVSPLSAGLKRVRVVQRIIRTDFRYKEIFTSKRDKNKYQQY